MKTEKSGEMLRCALAYLEAGYSIIPVGQDKKPLIPWEEFQRRNATKKEVLEWWVRYPEANIGMVTGSISGICAVDNDDPNSKHQLLKTIDEFAQPPVSITPRGGNHMIFGMPTTEVRNTVNFMEKVDFRGEGGYIVVPPSTNGNGKGYVWKRSILDTDIPVLPDSIIKAIQERESSFSPFKRTKRTNTNIKNNNIYKGCDIESDPNSKNADLSITSKNPSEKVVTSCDKKPDSVTSCDMISNSVTSCDKFQEAVTSCDIFVHGQRDENLFHIANCLAQTRNNEVYIAATLRAIVSSWGERDERWIWTKVDSAMKRAMRRERNIQQEVDAFISTTSGHFQVNACYGELQILSKQDKAAVRKALARRLGQTIEKYGDKDGVYRRIDTDIEYIDFSEEEGAISSVQLPLHLHEMVEVCEGNIILCSGEYNAGKGHPYGTPLMTKSGWKNIEHIKIGDVLYSENGDPIMVDGVYHRGEQKCYEFIFNDGSKIEVDKDHIWSIMTYYNRTHTKTGHGNRNTKFNTFVNYSTQDIVKKCGTGIISLNKRFILPQLRPIKYSHKNVKLDPYLLGVLLGDGHFGSSTKITSQDPEILDAFRNNGYELRHEKAYDYRIIGMSKVIREIGLSETRSDTKYVPKEYLINSVENRLSLLAGFLDTDGYVSKDRCSIEYVSVSKQLAHDVKFLVQSLGGRCIIAEKSTTYEYNGEKLIGKKAYRLTIKLNNVCPFRLQRKKEQYRVGEKTDAKIIRQINEIGYKKTICIKVSNPTGLYVAKDFVVTHNTGFCLNALQMNKNNIRIRYISSEMKAGEFKKRWRNFGLPYDFWLPDEMTDYVKLNNNLCSIIVPDALNIIDYMEFKDGDYTKGAEYLTQIHDKLTTGVAIVAIQHKEGSRLPRAGDLVMEKPRLSIAFRKTATDTDNIMGSVEILKAKNIRKGKCDGKKLMFEIVDGGSRFKITNDWGYYR